MKGCRWITNTPKEHAKSVMQELMMGHYGRVIIKGKPKASDEYTVEILSTMGIIGLYEKDTHSNCHE